MLCVCRKCLSSPSCRSELIDTTWVVIIPGQKCINKKRGFQGWICVDFQRLQGSSPSQRRFLQFGQSTNKTLDIPDHFAPIS